MSFYYAKRMKKTKKKIIVEKAYIFCFQGQESDFIVKKYI